MPKWRSLLQPVCKDKTLFSPRYKKDYIVCIPPCCSEFSQDAAGGHVLSQEQCYSDPLLDPPYSLLQQILVTSHMQTVQLEEMSFSWSHVGFHSSCSILCWSGFTASCSQADSEVLYAVITLPTVIMTYIPSLGRTFHLHCYSNCIKAPMRRSAQVGKSLVALTLILPLTSSIPFWAASPLPSLPIYFFFPENFLWLGAVIPAQTDSCWEVSLYFQAVAQNLQCIPGKQGLRHLQRNLEEPCLSSMNPKWQ